MNSSATNDAEEQELNVVLATDDNGNNDSPSSNNNYFFNKPPPQAQAQADAPSFSVNFTLTNSTIYSNGTVATTATATETATTGNNIIPNSSNNADNNDNNDRYNDGEASLRPSPNKRLKQQTTPEQCLDVIHHLNRAVHRKECIAAITRACAMFDHNDTDRHDFEIEDGAAHVALFKMLSIVLTRSARDGLVGFKGDEVQQMCRSLEMVHRCSRRCLEVSYEEVGEDLIALIGSVMERCLDGVIRDDGDVGILSCVQVLLYYSSEVRKAVKHMGKSTVRGKLLGLLVRVASAGNMIDERAKELSLKVISHLGGNSDSCHRRNISSTDILLLDTLIDNAFHSAESVRNNAALGLNNLACHNEHLVTMSCQERVLDAVSKLLSDDCTSTRQYAASTIKNLSELNSNSLTLVNHGYGTLLSNLVKIVENDESDEARRSASRALANMACTSTAEAMCNHDDLLKTLATVTISDDTKETIREATARTLKQLSYTINAPMTCHEDLLNALIRATFSDDSVTQSVIGKALLTQSSNKENRKAIMEQKQLFAGLANMSAHNQHANVAGILRNLALDDEFKEALGAEDEVLGMLSTAVAISGDASKYAVKAISHLSTNSPNKKILANYRGLIEGLVKATRTTSDPTLRTW
eukprot:CAMPEP_0196817036 /NCGR_PEP_ID=MMETSP1362-20130617/58419_1 /TAXON_ID=163516 /ORGANISM="Leptocylindrus danicus, Strain CCMP1856" /LENGTH=641 /DNA_ID=CAMNT_0042194569 /DNA_START=236 /DNA_END=2158 /DNA_ORIENTATION=-